MTELMALQMKFDLPVTLAKLLELLAKHPVVTFEMVEVQHRITKDAKVAIHRLRRRHSMSDIKIHSRRDFGYWLETEDRKRVLEAMKLEDVAA